jgi:hypothetical protein
MYVSLSHLRVAEPGAPELIAAFRARAHLVDDADGFIDLQVWQSDRGVPHQFINSGQGRLRQVDIHEHPRFEPNGRSAPAVWAGVPD